MAAHRFADRLGIVSVVLVALDVGLDEVLAHQPRLVSKLADLARPKMRSGISLHSHQTW